MNDKFFIAKAIALAAKGKFNTKPGVNVGSIIVKNQKIIGTRLLQRLRRASCRNQCNQRSKEKIQKKFPLNTFWERNLCHAGTLQPKRKNRSMR